MRESDVCVTDAAVSFRPIDLERPFMISGRLISWFSVAEVTVSVESRDGRHAEGTGATILSVPWAWPVADVEVEARDAVLRRLTQDLAIAVVGGLPADPIETWRGLYAELGPMLVRAARQAGVDTVPRLAGLLALGAVDSAVHDAWARAAERPASAMYSDGFLSSDLGWVDRSLMGKYPSDFLVGDTPRLPVQHVIGAADPLTAPEAAAGERSLEDWLRTEATPYLKIKVRAEDPAADARRVVDVAEVAARYVRAAQIAIDPNEGYDDPADVVMMLEEIDRLAPEVTRALAYLEQPVPRDARTDPTAMRALSRRVPTLLDEGFSDVALLPQLRDLGWSGIVVKAGKGQTPALLAYSYARANDLWVTVQDLTAVSLAFVHSARLVSAMALSSPHLEYNSRQYAPRANDELAARHPELATVREGHVHYPLSETPGLYQLTDRAG